MKRFLRIILVLCVGMASCSVCSYAQSVKSLKQKQAKAQKEIRETSSKIKKNTAETRKSLNQLNSITAEIGEQQKQIDNLVQQLDTINKQLQLVNDSISRNEQQLQKLRDEYGKSIRRIRAHSSSIDKLVFIFQAKSFQQALRRVRYLREFGRWQKRRVAEIGEMQSRLEQSRNRINQLATSKSNNIKEQNYAQMALVQKKQQQAAVVDKLKKEGNQLREVLAEKQRQSRALDQQLERLIEQERIAAEKKAKEEAERRRKAEEAKRKAGESVRKKEDQGAKEEPAKPAQPKKKEPEKVDVELSGSFEENKGKLPYPVTGRFKIVRGFGVQKHPELKYVTTENGGIDIETSAGAVARAVFPGKVSAIFRQDGFNTVVMVRHGSYLTIYVNLSEIYVQSGQTIKANQNIGKIYSDREDDNRTVLHFEIRKEKQKLNPEQWLRR